MKRPIQIISVFMVVLLLGATAFSGYSEFKVDRASAEIAKAEKLKYDTYLLADEFRQSSDDLTRFARQLATTGDRKYLEFYQTVLDIRNGNVARPADYHQPYWDIITAGNTLDDGEAAGRTEGQIASIQDRMIAAGFTDAELTTLNNAVATSDQLVAMETEAMNAAQGLFPDASGKYTIQGPADLTLAKSIMFSDAYMIEKAKISTKVREFFHMVESRIDQTELAAIEEQDSARSNANIALSTLAVASILVGAFMLIFCVVPLRKLTNAMQALASGRADTEIPCQQAKSEFGILARQIGDYKAASDKTAEMGEEARKSREAAEAQKETALALQAEMDKVVEAAMEGDFTARIDIASDDDATRRIADDMNNLMSRLDEATLEVVRALTALGEGDVEVPMDLHGNGRFHEMENTGENARHRLGELISQMTESAEEARQSQERVLKQQEVSQRLQIEIDEMISEAQQGNFSKRIEIDTSDEAAHRIATGMNSLMERYDETISELIEQLHAFGDGNLVREMSLSSAGRFGELQVTADTTRRLLTELIESVSHSANSVQDAVSKMRSDAQTVSGSMQNQAASIEETSAATTEMTQAIKDSAVALTGASDLATNVNSSAAAGSETVSAVVTAVEEIKSRSDKIADIVSIIENISFQTNLLALNATVEAARAGDAGRGFAVVASEVRNLSLRASDAATDIANLISATTESVDEGVVLAHKAGTALTEISKDIAKLRENIEDVSSTGRDQAMTFQEIEQAVGEINQSTQTTASTAERSAELADTLVDTAGALRDTLAKFTISHSEGDEYAAA